MKAVVLEAPGALSGLRLLDVPEPEVGPDEVLVRVRACGVCHHDLAVADGLLRRGVRRDLILGHEIAGEVAAVGPQAEEFHTGDRVVAILTTACGRCSACTTGNEHRCAYGFGVGHGSNGGYAEYVCLPQGALRAIPEGVSFAQASVCACPIGVVLRGVLRVATVRPGERVLVTGAGGGLGVHSVQAARLAGAQVIAVTGSGAKVERLRLMGADEVVVSPMLDFQWEVRALTQDSGVDVIIDTIGSAAFQAAAQCLAPRGRLLFLGEIAGGEVSFSPTLLMFLDAQLLGSTGSGRADLDLALRLAASGAITPVATEFPLPEAPAVHRLIRERQVFGRAVLVP